MEKTIVAQVVVFCKNSIGVKKNGITMCGKNNYCANLRCFIVFAKSIICDGTGTTCVENMVVVTNKVAQYSTLFFLLEECPHVCGKCVQQMYEFTRSCKLSMVLAKNPRGVCGKQGFGNRKPSN